MLGKESPKLLVMSNTSYSSKSDFPFLSQLGIRVTSPTWVESVVQILQGETEENRVEYQRISWGKKNRCKTALG